VLLAEPTAESFASVDRHQYVRTYWINRRRADARIRGSTPGIWTLCFLVTNAEGGWGIAGTAFGREEFAALAAKKT